MVGSDNSHRNEFDILWITFCRNMVCFWFKLLAHSVTMPASLTHAANNLTSTISSYSNKAN